MVMSIYIIPTKAIYVRPQFIKLVFNIKLFIKTHMNDIFQSVISLT